MTYHSQAIADQPRAGDSCAGREDNRKCEGSNAESIERDSLERQAPWQPKPRRKPCPRCLGFGTVFRAWPEPSGFIPCGCAKKNPRPQRPSRTSHKLSGGCRGRTPTNPKTMKKSPPPTGDGQPSGAASCSAPKPTYRCETCGRSAHELESGNWLVRQNIGETPSRWTCHDKSRCAGPAEKRAISYIAEMFAGRK